MSVYLLLNGLQVQHANAMTSWNVMGGPAVTAHVGLAGAIAHRYGLKEASVAILHQGWVPEGDFLYGRLVPNRFRGAPQSLHPGDRKMLLSDQPFAQAHYRVSLMIRIEGEGAGALADQADDGRLQSWLMTTGRLAGGVITELQSVKLAYSLEEARLNLPKTGHWVVDRHELIQARAPSEDQLDAALLHLYPEQPKPQKGAKIDKPWLAMSLVGYVLLEKPTSRGGTRQNLPHAFCEPLLGLIEYRSKRRTDALVPLFWRLTQLSTDVVVARTTL